jgi:putative transposase
MARLVVPDHPHHVTQRGNRRQLVFFDDDDYRAYLALVRDSCQEAQTSILAYCLMPNHVHFLMVPNHEDGLRASIAEAHRRYTRRVNFREGWRGHLWQGRFGSVVMDEAHLAAAVPYVERNPVRAGLAERASDWPWSSARAYRQGAKDPLVDRELLQRLLPGFDGAEAVPGAGDEEAIRQHTRTGRPLGDEDFVERLEAASGRALRPRPPGPRPGGTLAETCCFAASR